VVIFDNAVLLTTDLAADHFAAGFSGGLLYRFIITALLGSFILNLTAAGDTGGLILFGCTYASHNTHCIEAHQSR